MSYHMFIVRVIFHIKLTLFLNSRRETVYLIGVRVRVRGGETESSVSVYTLYYAAMLCYAIYRR